MRRALLWALHLGKRFATTVKSLTLRHDVFNACAAPSLNAQQIPLEFFFHGFERIGLLAFASRAAIGPPEVHPLARFFLSTKCVGRDQPSRIVLHLTSNIALLPAPFSVQIPRSDPRRKPTDPGPRSRKDSYLARLHGKGVLRKPGVRMRPL